MLNEIIIILRYNREVLPKSPPLKIRGERGVMKVTPFIPPYLRGEIWGAALL
jgi:hypothetical protein